MTHLRVPEITKDDLRAFIGGSDKCRSKEVYDYIAEQREIEDSWIKQWFDDFIRKCNAEPEEIDWALLFAEEISELETIDRLETKETGVPPSMTDNDYEKRIDECEVGSTTTRAAINTKQANKKARNIGWKVSLALSVTIVALGAALFQQYEVRRQKHNATLKAEQLHLESQGCSQRGNGFFRKLLEPDS